MGTHSKLWATGVAAGEAKPFRDFTFALGPINLRMKKGRPQFLWRDNMHWAVTNAVGLSSVLLPSGDSTHISFDWQSLSFNYQGGYAAKILRGYGYGAYSILNADPSSTQLMEHERTHMASNLGQWAISFSQPTLGTLSGQRLTVAITT